jgi:hypothetical protein
MAAGQSGAGPAVPFALTEKPAATRKPLHVPSNIDDFNGIDIARDRVAGTIMIYQERKAAHALRMHWRRQGAQSTAHVTGHIRQASASVQKRQHC